LTSLGRGVLTMIQKAIGSVLALGLASPAGVAMAADTSVERIEASSSWTLEGSEERCSLLRNFGSGDDQVQLQIDSFGRADKFTVTLVGRPVPRPMNLRDELRYGFDADAAQRQRVGSTHGRSGQASWVKFDTNFRPGPPVVDESDRPISEGFARSAEASQPDTAFEQQVRSLSVQFDRNSHIELALGSMAQPLAALRACLGELHQHWGLDPAQQQTVSRFPIPDPSAVRAIMADYPDVMQSQGMNAYIPVRVMVGADGQPGACAAQIPDVEGDFVSAICRAMTSRFTPAVDVTGKTMPSFFQVHVLYSMN
jgi:hypothetical protein